MYSKKNRVRDRDQINTRVFAPMQEISNSIYSMMKRVTKLTNCSITDQEYLTLLNRIKTQAFCLQGVCKDKTMKNSDQYRTLLAYFQNLSNDKKINNLVKHCASEISKIITGEIDMLETLTYQPVMPTPQMVTNFYRASNKMDKHFELAEKDPEAYKRKAKIDLNNPENHDFKDFQMEEKKSDSESHEEKLPVKEDAKKDSKGKPSKNK